MIFRIAGIAVTLAIIAYMMGMVMRGQEAIENSPVMQENKAALRDAGMPVDDRAAMERELMKQAQDIQNFQQQVDEMNR